MAGLVSGLRPCCGAGADFGKLKFAEEQASSGLHVEKVGYYPTPGKPWILVVNKPSA